MAIAIPVLGFAAVSAEVARWQALKYLSPTSWDPFSLKWRYGFEYQILDRRVPVNIQWRYVRSFILIDIASAALATAMFMKGILIPAALIFVLLLVGTPSVISFYREFVNFNKNCSSFEDLQ
jgi:hypothetical protein